MSLGRLETTVLGLPNRLLRVLYVRGASILIASDIKGRIHKLDEDLRLLQSSPVVSYTDPINALCVTDKAVFTKDRYGTIGKWDLETLEPLDFLDGTTTCDRGGLYEDEIPSPSPNRGLAVLNGRLYTCNAYNQFLVIDAETFTLLEVRETVSGTFIDCICADDPQLQAMSDVDGRLWIGNVETNHFPVMVEVDSSVVHSVAFDWRHRRFWTTQDGGNGSDRWLRTGITAVGADGSGFQEYKLSHEDNEFLAFDEDCRFLLTGGFNGKLAVFDNEHEEFHLTALIGPLEFQVIHGAIASRDQIYALLQTGDLIRLDGQGREVTRAAFRNRCVWILEPHPTDDALLYAGTDYGVAILRYGEGKFDTVSIEQLARHAHGMGICKDVKPLPDGSYVAIARKGVVFRADVSGALLWSRPVGGIPRSIAISPSWDRCMVASDDGMLTEYDVESGTKRAAIDLGSPCYGCLYLGDGRRLATASAGPAVHVYPADGEELIATVGGFDYPHKRMLRGPGGKVFTTGSDGMVEIDLDAIGRGRVFSKGLTNTRENGVVCQDHVYVGGYGYQIATYRYTDAELVDLKERLPDYTKAFAARVPPGGAPILLVGGRGGFICAYRTRDGLPQKVREYYVQ